ncbi:MAG: DUF1343 domain-containing protein [Candidatus Sericytochromatia bacterium]|nr:DUF1343 domain-containing protein [Candidatus Sericytochromatia bacterium]
MARFLGFVSDRGHSPLAWCVPYVPSLPGRLTSPTAAAPARKRRAAVPVAALAAWALLPGPGQAAALACQTGLDVVLAQPPAAWHGQRLGLVTHDAARDARGRPAAEALAALPGVRLVRLFAPEHGLRGAAEGPGRDGRDARTGLPVVALHGRRPLPPEALLGGLDALVVDMQDAGTRHYTYEQTLWSMLEAAGRSRKAVWVLDRPTPVPGPAQGAWPITPRGLAGGPPVPLRHGLTLGELARYAVRQLPDPPELRVVRVRGWAPRKAWPQGHRWHPPSPALREAADALRYCGLGLFEATNVDCRRPGQAFRWFGARWVDAPAVVRLARKAGLPGVGFRAEACGGVPGVAVDVLDAGRYEPVDTGLVLLEAFSRRHPRQLRISAGMAAALAGSEEVVAMVRGRRGWRHVSAAWRAQGARFEAAAQPCRLYRAGRPPLATFPPSGRSATLGAP